MITREADYALRAIIYLARKHENKYCPTSDICSEMLIPYRFLRKISRKLVESGIAVAQRGKQGGLCLAKKPEQLSLLEILKVFDPRALTLNKCCKNIDECERKNVCEAHDSFAILQQKLETEFDRITIDELVKNKT